MKVFVSSVISGLEDHRAAAREGAASLRHAVIASEDFGASPGSPQQVCLAGVREADMVILLLGARYGTPQASGLSPTHEEYRAVRGAKPVFVFMQADVTPELDQQAFIKEVDGWEGGTYQEPFDTPASLRNVVTRALHDWEMSLQVGPVNDEELLARAAALLPQRASYSAGAPPLLHVVVAGAPAQQLLRPANLDDPALHSKMEQQALYGPYPVLARGQGARADVSGITLSISQANAEITLNEQGSIRVTRPSRDASRGFAPGIPSLIEEDIHDRTAAAIHYAGWLLDQVDPTRHLTKVALAARLDSVHYLPWRTRQEAAVSPNSASMNFFAPESADSPPVILTRPALVFDAANQADDITIRLRRQAKR